MSNKIKTLFAVLVLVAFCALGVMLVKRHPEPAQMLRVESIEILPASFYETKQGYDMKVQVIVYPTGKAAEKIENGVLVASSLTGENARFILDQKKVTKSLQQKPVVHVSVGKPEGGSTLSFLYHKSKLPQGRIMFRGIIRARVYYNIHESGTVRVEERTFPGIPVQIRIQ